MKILKYRLAFLLVIASIFIQTAHARKEVSDANLPNFSPVNENFYRGGQPSEAGVKELARMGIKTIINLRGADEHSRAEELWARNAGVKIISHNLSNWFEPRDAEIERVIEEINEAENQPVFVHCKRGADRTGTVVAVYRISFDGWTAEQANREAKRFGFGWWQIRMKNYIGDYSEELEDAKREMEKAN